MAEENMLKSVVDSDELSVGNVRSVRETENDLIDELSKKNGESSKEFDELKDEMDKTASGILTATEKLAHGIEDEVTEILEEGKRKLDNLVSNVNCDFSGVISDSITLTNKVQERASKNLEDIMDETNRFAENIGEIIPEKANELKELEKMERRTEGILAIMNNEGGELAENIGEMASEISTGFEELCKVTVTSKLGEATDKNVDRIVSEKVSAFEEFSNEKAVEKLEERDEFTKETFGEFQKLNEEADNNTTEVEKTNEELEDFKEGINEKTNEINMRKNSEEKDIVCGSVDGEKRIIEISDICVMENENNIKQDEFSGKNPAGAANLLDAANIDNLQSNTFGDDIEEMKEVTEKIALKSEYDKEIQAIKKIVSAGENVPEQVGILSENGIYHDDYEPEKPENIVTAKLRDFVNDEVDEVDKLLEEAFNVDRKLKEPGITDDGTDQEDDIHQKEAKEIEASTDTISEVFQKINVNQHCIACEEIQGQEAHDMMIDLNDSSIATGDSKSGIQFIGVDEQKSANISPQLPPISEQAKKLILSTADEPEPRVLQHPNITESSNIASKNTKKKEAEFKHSSEAMLESDFVRRKAFIVDEEKTECEVKPIPVSLHPDHFTSQDATNINKTLSAVPGFSSSNIVPSLFQSSASEDILKFSTTPTALENALQSMKGNDQDKIIMEAKVKPIQEKIEPELQSAKTTFAEKSINLGGPPNHTPPLSPESTISLRQSVLSPKNAPPPVPPKKKSIEMILAEEAKAMRQNSLRGFEALVQGTANTEVEKDELKSENEMKQNIKTPTIQEKAETAANKNEKHEMMQNPESQKMRVTPLTQTEKLETQKEKIHPILPTTEVKSQEVTSEKNKTDTVKLKTGDGQQQQSRRCTVL